MLNIKEHRLPCRLRLKDPIGFLAFAEMQGKDSLEYAKQICVLKTVRVHRADMTIQGVIGYDTGIPSKEPFYTVALSEEEINLFFELDIPRDIL